MRRVLNFGERMRPQEQMALIFEDTNGTEVFAKKMPVCIVIPQVISCVRRSRQSCSSGRDSHQAMGNWAERGCAGLNTLEAHW